MNDSQLTRSDRMVRSEFKNHTYEVWRVRTGIQISKEKFIHIYI